MGWVDFGREVVRGGLAETAGGGGGEGDEGGAGGISSLVNVEGCAGE